VDVAGEPVALLEDRLAPLLDAAPLDDAAMMQRERRLPRDRLAQVDAPPLCVALFGGRVHQRQPAERLAADDERSGDRRAASLHT